MKSWLGIVVFCMGLAGCNCDSAGCLDGFQIYLERELAMTADVRFELRIGGETLACQLGEGTPGTCSAELNAQFGACRDVDGLCVGSLRVEGQGYPAQTTLTIFEGEESTMHEVDLDYETWRPNGEGCPPQCTTAQATVEN